MISLDRIKNSIKEAEEYLESAESSYESILQKDDKIWNPVVVNCIMAMIKSVDALMLKKKRSHEQRSFQNFEISSRPL